MPLYKKTQRITGSSSLNWTFIPESTFQLLEVRFHLSGLSVKREDFTLRLDSGAGTEYDTLLYSKDMISVRDLIYTPDERRLFEAEDKVVFTWANTDKLTYGLEVVYKV